MSAKGATAEIFLAAFKTMAKKEQDIFLSNSRGDDRKDKVFGIAVTLYRKSLRLWRGRINRRLINGVIG